MALGQAKGFTLTRAITLGVESLILIPPQCHTPFKKHHPLKDPLNAIIYNIEWFHQLWLNFDEYNMEFLNIILHNNFVSQKYKKQFLIILIK